MTTFIKSEDLPVIEKLAASTLTETVRKRVRLLLFYEAGMKTAEIAEKVGLSPGRVLYWRRMYLRNGLAVFGGAVEALADSVEPVEEIEQKPAVEKADKKKRRKKAQPKKTMKKKKKKSKKSAARNVLASRVKEANKKRKKLKKRLKGVAKKKAGPIRSRIKRLEKRVKKAKKAMKKR